LKFEDWPSGRLFFGIRGVIAEYERELTRELTMRGRRERARTGLVVGGRVAYGYRYDAVSCWSIRSARKLRERFFDDYLRTTTRSVTKTIRVTSLSSLRSSACSRN
jgi:DNA invertase Pin-like site-specific DNA recombinase